jgi:hypothetical protein
MAQIEVCGTCKFYNDLPAESGVTNIGICSRFPPQLILMPQKQPDGQMALLPMGLRPQVQDADTCGEYRLQVMVKPPKINLLPFKGHA